MAVQGKKLWREARSDGEYKKRKEIENFRSWNKKVGMMLE
jgi:hypothetical protein